ncbi:MAG: ABC transporter substrate-binding protein [Gammaproteobacteria bacterium]|nr:ABC transporter substrate-binding protein [Gammaproteobacteria bacterium]
MNRLWSISCLQFLTRWLGSLATLCALSIVPLQLLAAEFNWQEVPSLKQAVTSGALPPLKDRVPISPSIVSFTDSEQTLGEYGGELRLLMGKPKDIRMMMVYGYARLVCYDRDFNLVPDILERVDNDQNKAFTLHLRPGHKWSDGHLFTSEDFRYYWEDVANNPDLSLHGPPQNLLVDGEQPVFEVLDETTVRYRWTRPNPDFLPTLAGASPLFIYRPAHYLKQFHANYVDQEVLEGIVEEAGTRNWAGLHHRMDHQYKFDNPNLPVLQPWGNTTAPPSEHFIFERNPFYHRVDSSGKQLPYIDRVIVDITSTSLVPAKTGTGESDLQARYLRLDNYTFLKAGEQRNDYTVRLWRTVKGAQIALFPNLNANDPIWRELIRDVRFRRALSLAIYRREINQVIYYGMVNEGNNTVLPESPLYRDDFGESWARFDLDEANRLLDEIGLTERDERGIRLLADGRPLEIIVHTAGESTEETDVLELVHDSWLRAGVKLYSKPSQREVFRNRVFSGDAEMSVWSGITNGVATSEMSPWEFAPTTQQQLQWPKWGQFFETGAAAGVLPDMPSVLELTELNQQWRLASTVEERTRIWQKMLEIHSDQVFTIGVVRGVRQPVVINNQLRNVPTEGIYNWDPGAYFGLYRPDTFWFTDARR